MHPSLCAGWWYEQQESVKRLRIIFHGCMDKETKIACPSGESNLNRIYKRLDLYGVGKNRTLDVCCYALMTLLYLCFCALTPASGLPQVCAAGVDVGVAKGGPRCGHQQGGQQLPLVW